MISIIVRGPAAMLLCPAPCFLAELRTTHPQGAAGRRQAGMELDCRAFARAPATRQGSYSSGRVLQVTNNDDLEDPHAASCCARHLGDQVAPRPGGQQAPRTEVLVIERSEPRGSRWLVPHAPMVAAELIAQP